MSDIFERFLAFGLAGASIIISLLDFTGLLQGIPFLAGHISALTLLVIGATVGYLALERRSKLDKIQQTVTQELDKIQQTVTQGFEKTLSSLGGGPVKLLKDSTDLFAYLALRVKEAHNSVEDLTWGDHLTRQRTAAQAAAFKKYISAISSATIDSPLEYREVMTFPSEVRLERVESLKGKEHFGYQLRYYDIDHKLLPTLLQFTIIDSDEVIFTFHRGTYTAAEPEIYLATRQREIVQIFKDYFNSIWERATIIKATGQSANPQVLQHIKQEYHKNL